MVKKRIGILFALFILLVSACSNPVHSNKKEPVTGIQLDETSLYLELGASSQLVHGILPANASNKKVSWVSSDPESVSVDSNGIITGLKLCENVLITVTTEEGGFSADCSVNVVSIYIPVVDFEIEPEILWMKVNHSERLITTFYPANATSQAVRWESSHPEIASVDENGYVTGKSEGSAVVTGITEDGGFRATCDVVIRGVQNIYMEEITLQPQSVTLPLNQERQLNAVIVPSNATNQGLIWESSDEDIAQVDANGLVTPISKGRVQIKVTSKEDEFIYDYCSVHVVDEMAPLEDITLNNELVNLIVGGESLLIAEFEPEFTAEDPSLVPLLQVEIDNPAVLSFENESWKSWKVTGLSAGEANVTVKLDSGEMSATCHYIVSETMVEIDSIVINDGNDIIVELGQDSSIPFKTIPENATEVFSFVSDNPGVSVDRFGRVAIDEYVLTQSENIPDSFITVTAVDSDSKPLGSCRLEFLISNENLYNYSINIDDSLTITGFTAFQQFPSERDKTSFVIPESIDGRVVTGIGSGAFWANLDLAEVSLPDSLEFIGYSAFVFCRNLRTIELPPSLSYIGSGAFSSCVSLETITIPGGITAIQSSTFSWCTGLREVTLPDSVTVIDYDAFSGCANLRMTALPPNLESIGKSAFSGCYMLSLSSLPDSVSSIGEYGFIGSGVRFSTLPSNLDRIGGGTFMNCNLLSDMVLPPNITSIGENAFNSSSLKSITIPASTEIIRSGAFSECEKLVTVNIAEGVETLGDYVFSACTLLEEITLPETVSSIGKSTFEGCGKLSVANLPTGLRIIPERTFFECRMLSSFRFPENLEIIGTSAFRDCEQLNNTALPDTVMEIGEYAFVNTGVLFTELPPGLTIINNETFYNCDQLTNIVLPDNIQSIGKSAFGACSMLDTVVIPASVDSIGDMAFLDSDSLERVVLMGTTPPSNLGMMVFAHYSDVFPKEIIYVPSSALEVYENHDEWSEWAAWMKPY